MSLAECLSHELSTHELLVAAVEQKELLVSALLNNVALAHANDLVSVDDRA